MPALPQQPVAVRHISPTPSKKEHYPYTNGMGSINNTIDRGKQGASAISTSNRNPNNSMYSAMKEHWVLEEQQKIVEEITSPKIKKVAQSAPRPSTPHGNRQKNFVEKKKLATSPQKSIKKPSKDDSQSISPNPSLKQKSTVTRPVTPGANGQSSTRPKVDKKKNDGVISTTKSRRSTSPSSTSPSAHSRSHVRVASPENLSPPPQSGHGSAHSRSHVRVASPEIALREEVKKLKRVLLERDDELREKEAELLDAEDIVESLQERVREVEARNRELQTENEFMRNYIEEEKKKSVEPTNMINSVVNNIQRIRGEPASPISKPNSPVSSKSSSPMSSPKPSPVLTTSKSRELLKANNNISKVQNDLSPSLRPHIVPQTRGNLIVSNKGNNKKNPVNKNDSYPPRPMAPSPAAMNRYEPNNNNDGFNRTEIMDRHAEMMARDRKASALDRKQAAALNVVMEESEDSEVDEFVFGHDDETTTDDQSDSESEVTTESENEDDDATSVSPSGINTENEEEDDDEFDKWSTHASSKHDLDSIVEEEDEEDEDDEFECEPQQMMNRQKQKIWNTSNPISPVKNSFANVAQVASVGIAPSQNVMTNVSGKFNNKDQSPSSHKQRSQKRNGLINRDSMSSVKSDSSDDSTISVSSSQNGSYPSTVTSPSSTDSTFNNGLYGQSSADSSNKLSSFNNGISKINGKNGLNDNYPTSVSNSQHDNSADKYNSGISDKLINSKRSPNLVSKQFTPRSSSPIINLTRAPSPASSSRASTPSSNASTARAPTPASASSSRASTPASESSRNASGYPRRSRPNENSNSSSDKTAIPPPPPPPVNKDPFATLQHYLRLISENSVMENPLKSYDIKKVIDEGSSAKVYTAHPLSNPSEECAVKVVPLSYSLEFIFNEIYVLKNLKHKNIVDFKESFLRWDGKTREVWIAMEKCARGDVTSRAGKVNQREVGRIAGDLLGALKHLHANGVIHRDIKLSNILADANNNIKLADFGISSLTPTSTTSMVGTIPYMAPDVVLVGPDRPYDTKVDIWSVGVCILELLTGKAAWGRSRDDEILDKLRRGEMPYGFHRLRKKADIGWEAIDFLEKCFIRTPENRWSAEKLLEHPFITGNSI
uniref:Serine/threonine-protein kinase STE20 n=1 Tax=Anthurium amnicola TaxID=1678845 RepID=A0A1D1XL69_9ARAE